MPDELVKEVHEIRASVSSRFTEKWNDALENAKFYRMDQYTDSQLKKFIAQDRVPYTFDFITAPLNTFVGLQRDMRRDIIYLPFERNDEVKVELLNVVKDSTLRNNGFLYTESDIFQDGLIEKTGVLGYEWTDEFNPLGELKLFRVPPRQVCWDLNCREFELDKGEWVSRLRLFPKGRLKNRYPEYAKDIENMSIESFIDEMDLDSSYTDSLYDGDVGAVGLVEFYKREYDIKYLILSNGNILDESFSKEKDAKNFIKDLHKKYEQIIIPQFLQIGQNAPPLPNYGIKAKSYPFIRKIATSGNIVFENEVTDLPGFPYDKYHPYFHDGEYWGHIDLVKDPQRFINRTMSMVDHQMMTGSKGLLILSDKIIGKQKKELVDKWSKTGGVVDGVKDPDNNIKYIEPKGFDPRMLTMVEFAVNNAEKKSGGLNFMGQRETSNESGTLFNQRVQQGSLMSFVMFDNLARFKKCVGLKVAFYLTHYLENAEKIRIEGEELTKMAMEQFPQWFEKGRGKNIGYMKVNTDGNNTLKGLKYDVIVEETRHSVTKNQMVLQQIGALISQSPMLAETISPKRIVGLLDLPASEKQKWEKDIDMMMQTKMEQDNQARTKPPSLSASLSDITLLPPEAQAQLAALFGIQLGEPVEDNTKQKTVIDTIRKKEDLDFKRQKHEDQMTMKTLTTLVQGEIEKYKVDNSSKEKKGQTHET